MGQNGITKFFGDWSVALDSPTCTIFSFLAGAQTMGEYTKEEFNKALRGINAYDIKTLIAKKSWLEKQYIQNHENFTKVYLFAFNNLAGTQKFIPTEYAIMLMNVLLKKRYTLSEKFIKFLGEYTGKNEIFKDEWKMSLEFLNKTSADLSDYNENGRLFSKL